MTYHVPRRTPGAYASALGEYALAHQTGFGRVPAGAELEAQGWVKVGEVPGMVGMWVMKRAGV